MNLLGRSREEALEHLGQRCRSQDVSAFTAQLMQAVSQGSSLTEGLAVQAALARETGASGGDGAHPQDADEARYRAVAVLSAAHGRARRGSDGGQSAELLERFDGMRGLS